MSQGQEKGEADLRGAFGKVQEEGGKPKASELVK
jgi:hypothetical protein